MPPSQTSFQAAPQTINSLSHIVTQKASHSHHNTHFSPLALHRKILMLFFLVNFTISHSHFSHIAVSGKYNILAPCSNHIHFHTYSSPSSITSPAQYFFAAISLLIHTISLRHITIFFTTHGNCSLDLIPNLWLSHTHY